MAARDWRAQKREGTRRRLTAAAFTLFEEQGFDAVSVGEIAAAAQVSVPTFYAYFRTKEHIVLPEQDLAWVGDHLARQPAGLPLPEQLRRGLQSMVVELPEPIRRELLRRWRLVLAVPALRLRSRDREQVSYAVIIEALGIDLTTSRGATDAVVVAACLSAATTALLRWATTDGTHPLEELIDEAFAALRSI